MLLADRQLDFYKALVTGAGKCLDRFIGFLEVRIVAIQVY